MIINEFRTNLSSKQKLIINKRICTTLTHPWTTLEVWSAKVFLYTVENPYITLQLAVSNLSIQGLCSTIVFTILKKLMFTYKTEKDLEKELMVTGGGGEWGERTVREFGMDMYTLLYLKWITNKVLVYSTGSSAQCCVQPGWEGRMDVCIHVWPSPFAVHLKLAQHCWLYPNTK